MKHFTAFFCFILSFSLMAQTGTEGYYKDIFMDGGVSLTSRTSLAAADSLSLSLEYLATDDQDIQNDKIIGDVWDYNGALLYPDGEPRFRHIQTNGGAATSHGSSLTQAGRERIRAFYYNGGCYTGCCAGAFIVSLNAQETDTNNSYYHIWPGRTQSTGLLDTYTGHFIEPGCPLLQFNDFGGDDYIDNLYHNGGCFAREFTDFPPETEVLLRFDYSGYTMHQKPSSWAYKKNAASGRLVVIGSHPEGVTSGERLELMKAMILYAIDGQGELSVKDTLQNGQTRNMDKSTEDNDPAYAKIGDRQYHHFAVDLPEGAAQFIVTLTGEPGYHLNLFVRQGEYAFQSNAAYSDTMSGSNKILTVGPVPPGTYYISVECATTVVTAEQSWGYEYTDNMEVLDGVSYSIRSDWSLTDAPITNFYAADTSDCNGIINFIDYTAGAPDSWLWDFGDGAFSLEQNPEHEYISAGVYTVALVASNSYGSDTLIRTNYIFIDRPDAPECVPDETCGSGSLVLLADGSGVLNWYDTEDAGSSVFTGYTYVTAALDSTTIFYVESEVFPDPGYVGKITTGGDGGFFSGNPHGLVFDVYSDLVINSVKVIADGSGARLIELRDNTDSILQSANIYCPDGESRIILNFDVLPGSGYRLLGPLDAALFRNLECDSIQYPYTLADIISITGSTYAENYYFFYDWEVQALNSCRSARTPVTAYVWQEAPVAGFTYSLDDTVAEFTNTSTGAGAFYWDFGDGQVSQETDVLHVFESGNVYITTLVASNACGTDLFSDIIDLSSTMIPEADISDETLFFPNPVTDRMFINVRTSVLQTTVIKISDISNRIIRSESLVPETGIISLDLGECPAGVYFLSVTGGGISRTERFLRVE